VDADVVVCSSSGWAHGVRTNGRKIVFCHSPAKWIYQPQRYLGPVSSLLQRMALYSSRRWLLRWDQKAARSADRYLANSTMVGQQVREIYGVDADVVGPPWSLGPDGPAEPVEGVLPGFFLCAARPLPYKRVGAVIDAFSHLPRERLVVVGTSPEQLGSFSSPNARLLGVVSDEQLRWLYANCAGVVSAAAEDFGLTPLEAAAFGKPVAALRWGGFLDTVREGETGLFFDLPEPALIAEAVRRLKDQAFDLSILRAHAEHHSEERFIQRTKRAVDLEVGSAAA
jgi:glycosyltransferase involved in cell wall biosynthesis